MNIKLRVQTKVCTVYYCLYTVQRTEALKYIQGGMNKHVLLCTTTTE